MPNSKCDSLIALLISSSAVLDCGSVVAQENLGAIRSEYAQLAGRSQRELAKRNNERGPAAARGILLADPPSARFMQQWISRMAFLEARMARFNGDPRRPCDITGIYTPNCQPRR